MYVWSRVPVLAIAAGLLAGCAQSLPPLNFSVPNVGLSSSRLDAEIRSLTVTLGRPDEEAGDIDFILAETGGEAVSSGGTITEIWRTALQEALDRSLIFRDDGGKKVSLAVKVLKLDAPSAGISMATDAVARYEIIDRSNGDVIFISDIASKGEVPGDYAFSGATRRRESINRAVQNSILLFLQAAETIDLSRPMFPAGTRPPPPKSDKDT